jgi:hypothetical protein
MYHASMYPAALNNSKRTSILTLRGTDCMQTNMQPGIEASTRNPQDSLPGPQQAYHRTTAAQSNRPAANQHSSSQHEQHHSHLLHCPWDTSSHSLSRVQHHSQAVQGW